MDRESNCKAVIAKKANALIQASHNFTAYEQKLLLLLIAQQREGDQELCKYQFSVLELSKLFEVDRSSLYKVLDETTDKLTDKKVKFADSDLKSFEKGAIIPWAKLEDGILTLHINPELKPLFLELGNKYTLIPLENVFKLNRAHAIKLYEILYQWQGTAGEKGVHWERTVKIEDLRFNLGIEENQYPRIFDFKKWVLNDPLEEISAKTDISVTYELIKFGRSFNRVKFIVDREPPYTIKPKTKGKKNSEREEHEEYEKRIQRLENKLAKATDKEKRRFGVILKDIEDQEELFPDAAIKLRPETKKENNRRAALEEWSKSLNSR